MKRNFLSVTVLVIILSLSSCKSSSSSSFESDVRKMADYMCQQKKLAAKDPTDEKVKKEMEELQTEVKAYSNKMEEKYKDKKGDKDMDAKAEAILKDEMEKCK